MTKENNSNKREIVIPGEIISTNNELLPGDGTEKIGDKIIALKYGLAEESDRLIKIIPLSGVYNSRRGNVVIGKVENLTFNGWIIDIGTPENSFLSLMEIPGFVHKDDLDTVMDIGDMAVVKVLRVNKRGVDLTIKSRGLGKIEDGIIAKINPNKVPRVIGKEGSMIKLIKDETGCNITVGQNGLIWIKGDKVENELFAKKTINFISDKSSMKGLTEEVKKWFEKEKSK